MNYDNDMVMTYDIVVTDIIGDTVIAMITLYKDNKFVCPVWTMQFIADPNTYIIGREYRISYGTYDLIGINHYLLKEVRKLRELTPVIPVLVETPVFDNLFEL